MEGFPGALDVEQAVAERYSQGARAREAALCCPVDYDAKYLKIIPQEVIDRDYGCGDPSKHVHPGEVVLDLGSGGGKICFIASQVVGAQGRVIGVDVNEEMLALARSSAPVVAERLGYANVEFHKARIQDLALDRGWADARLREQPVTSAASWAEFEQEVASRRAQAPLIADNSVDVIVSNCVLNLVRAEDKAALFAEMFRVLKPGGRAVISDIASDDDVPTHMRNDAELWSGCISGALREDDFLTAFEDAGFFGTTVLERQVEPWQVVEEIEFRSMTVVAFKPSPEPCLDRGQAVIYRGPFRSVEDDDGHTYRRGVRVAVCDKTYEFLRNGPYGESFFFLAPAELVSLEQAPPFPSTPGMLVRPPQVTRGGLMESTAHTSAPKNAMNIACVPVEKGDGGCCC